MTLGDHLRAHQNVDLAIAKALQNALERAFSAGAIAIEPRDAGRGEALIKLLFHPLRTGAQKLDMFTAAFRACLGNPFGVAAVVAQHAPVALVMR